MKVREIKLVAAQTKGKSGKNEQVITRVVEKFNSRSKKDIKDWDKAVNAAGNITRPNRLPYYNICDEIEIDLHLTAVKQHGILDKIFAQEFRIVDDSGVIDEELTDFFRGQWFYDYCEHVIDAIFYGHSLIQVGDIIDVNGRKTIQDITLIPRRHVRPEFGEILKEQTDERGYPYRNDDSMMYWLVEVGTTRGLGLYKKIAPIVLFKKNVVSAWSEYCEIFGMPTRVGKTNSRDKKDLDRMEQQLEKAGKAAYALLQQGETFEFIESTKGDAFNVYDKFIERCNSEVSKAVVGSTLTTDTAPNGNRSLGDVHLQSSDNVTESIKRLITSVTRDALMVLLERRGLKVAGKKFEYAEQKDLKALFERTEKLIGTGQFKIDAEFVAWLNDTFGIPLKALEADTTNPPTNDPQPEPAKKPQKKKLSRDVSFIESLYKSCLCCETPAIKLAAGKQSDLDKASEALLKRVWAGAVEFDSEVFQAMSAILMDGLTAGWLNKKKIQLAYRNTSDFSIKYDAPDWETITQMEANLFKFSAAKTLAMVNELNKLLPDSKTFGEFSQKAAKVTGEYNVRTLRTEYNFAWQTAQNAAEYHRMVAEKDVYPYWQYITAGDSRVRPAHAALDKMTFKADDPAFSKIYPPNGWNCRCYVKPIRSYPESKLKTEQQALDALASTEVDGNGTSELDRMKKNGMDVNRAKAGVVFTQNQLYVKSFPEGGFGVKANYNSKDYTFENLDNGKLPELKSTIENAEAARTWFNEQAKDGEAVFKDYAERPIVLDSKTLNRKLKEGGSYEAEKRYELVTLIPDILQSPDEVWYQGNTTERGHTFNYIKMYNGEMVVVPVELKEGSLTRIKSFFKTQSDAERTGYLVKGLK